MPDQYKTSSYDVSFKIDGVQEPVTITANHGENILELARKANVAIDAPCSGNGSCGKCRVRLIGGSVYSKISRHITDFDFDKGWRLACESYVEGPSKFFVPDIAQAYKSRLRVTDMTSEREMRIFDKLLRELRETGITRHSGYFSAKLELAPPSLDDTMPDNERLNRSVQAITGKSDVSIRYSLLRRLPDILRENDWKVRCMLMEDRGGIRILDLMPQDDDEIMCGLAVDIGTTTVSVLLVDLESGKILSKGSSGNGQIRFGADVINRIIEQQKNGGVEKLRYAVVHETLLPIIHKLCDDTGTKMERIYRTVVAGNTTMTHLLLGVNANYLRTEPYVPTFFKIDPLFTREVGIDLSPGSRMTLCPNIGSYVGGDITSGTLASMIWNKQELSLFVDLGTNGEIVFGNSEFLMSCACSAGPAFEGGDIKCGMRATDGAIESCVIDPETLEPEISIFGDIAEKPVGLCGSGIIDVIAELYRTGAINGKGKFVRESPRIVRNEEYNTAKYILAFPKESATYREVYIDETDIDNFIRTKGAIFSAIRTLTMQLGFSPTDIEKVYVAGGIGSGLNVRNSICIGMFPDLPEERFEYIGNSSLSGAYSVLTSAAAEDKMFELSRAMTYIELSTQAGYMDEFVAACFLPHTDETLFPNILAD
ncbi:MAG: ASKHA domain-containing protein [Oscillospiraceae bacterium]|jgi:uncharacterized 2Fe-2S/4Fe-4S cluster protein (DUF4445 family)|nr:ASKHA domain-containing protein [Oscillospiraceae bacterium]